mgnify:CR=1 FL=1
MTDSSRVSCLKVVISWVSVVMSTGISLLFVAKILGGEDNRKDSVRTDTTDRTDMTW